MNAARRDFVACLKRSKGSRIHFPVLNVLVLPLPDEFERAPLRVRSLEFLSVHLIALEREESAFV